MSYYVIIYFVIFMTPSLNILDVKVAQYNDLSTAWKTEETFGSRKGKRYFGVSKTCRLALWSTMRPVRGVWRAFYPDVKRPECEADHSTLIPRLTMRGLYLISLSLVSSVRADNISCACCS